MRDRLDPLQDSPNTASPISARRRFGRLSRQSLLTLSAFLIFACLMLAMIGGSGYAGMKAGQTDQKARMVSTLNGYIIERYERGVDLFRKGSYALAAANFEEVLKYRPDYTAVRPLLATAQAAQTPHPPTPTPTAIPVIADTGKLFQALQDAHIREEWDAVISLSDQLHAANSDYEVEAVNDMRYDALVQRGLKRLRGSDEIEAGIYDLDQAAQIHALSKSADAERRSAVAYLDAISYFGADWDKTIEQLGQLSPSYRDVGEKLYEANLQAGNAYSETQDYCQAQARFTEALKLAGGNAPKLQRKQADATQLCALATPTPSISGTQTVSGAVAGAGGIVSGAGMSGRILYNAYDAGNGYSPLHVFNGSSTVIVGGGYQPIYQASAGVVALNGGSAIYGWYLNGGTGLLYNGTAYWPSLSPDGTRVAYGGGDGNIYIARLDGSVAPFTLTQGTWPAWGPTGQIAYQGCSDQCGVHLISPDNPNDRRRLTTSSGDINIQWSVNGGDLIYASNYSGAWEIYTINVSGSFRQLTNLGSSAGAPTFSPDGSRVAFESNRDGSWGIYTMYLDGSGLQKMLDLGSAHASWQSDRLAWVP